MMSITITSDLADEFGRAGQPVEVRTPDGRVIGVFTPAAVRYFEPEISEEELRRIEDDRDPSHWHTAAEVEAKLKELRRSS